MLNNELMLFDWSNFADNDIGTCWNIMSSRINTVVNKSCPVNNFKFAKEKPTWISDDLIELMKNRDAALKQYTKIKSD